MTLRHNVDRDFVFAAIADERRNAANLVECLDDALLATPSLCAGWDVKAVAAHLVSVAADGFWTFQWTTMRHLSLARAVDELARRRSCLPAAEIATSLRRCADRPTSPPVFGPLDPLADILVHSGDMRIPLGLAFSPSPQRTVLALDFLTMPWRFGFVPMGRLRGIRLTGKDIDGVWGRGAEIRGPVAALMMAACGRTALFDMLDGPGVPKLWNRLS
jgi:uncharacterized protein (TIGR03083 family)